MVTTKYQSLFKMVIQHDYYGNSRFDDLYIVPDERTSILFSNYKIICRTNSNTITAMISTRENKPLVPLDSRTLFRFYVFINGGIFKNISSLQLINTKDRLYYFGNRQGSKSNSRLYLSAPVPAYKNTETYEAGAIAKNGNRVFECIKANSNADKHNTAQSAFWRDILIHQAKYLPDYSNTKTYNPGDLVRTGTKVFECIKTNSAANMQDTSKTGFWTELTEIAYVTSADLVNAESIATAYIATYDDNETFTTGSLVTANAKFFEALQSNGKDNKHAPGDAVFWKEVDTAYIIEKLNFSLPNNLFAVIDICNDMGETAEFSLPLSIDDKKPCTFLIRFKNRSTLWKYISQQQSVKTIADTTKKPDNSPDPLYTFSNAGNPNEFISNEPVPLSLKPLDSLEMSAFVNNRNIKVAGLQNPNAAMVKLSDNTSNYSIFSEVYLNY